MRLSNKRKAPYYNFLHTVFIMLVFAGICAYIFEKVSYKKLGIEEILLIIIPLFILSIFYLRGRQIFEFDSDGEALSIKNRHIIPYFFAAVSDEFPKYKLLNYNILNYIFLKRLYISIKSKKSSAMVLKYDISNLTRKEISDLKRSLSKVISNNKEAANKSQEIE